MKDSDEVNSETYDEIDDEKRESQGLKGLILIIFAVLIGGLLFLVNKQEKESKRRLKECSFYTVMKPLRMNGRGKVYFGFIFKDKEYRSETKVGLGDIGLYWSAYTILRDRFWVQVNCDDVKTYNVMWEIPVPDTLSYVPFNGWEEIPYGLDSLSRVK